MLKKVNCSPAERPEAQEELHHGAWDISQYLTDFSIMKNLFFYLGGFVFAASRPVSLPSGPLTAPCHCLGPQSSKRAL